MTASEQNKCVQNKPEVSSEEGCRNGIRTLNDKFRQRLSGGQVFLTPGILELGQGAAQAIMLKVSRFDQFDDDNDPYGEHDMGGFKHEGHRIFWKIDYYDLLLNGGSSDPADPLVTSRVLTVMLASEY